MDNKISYDQVVEDGYLFAVDHNDPADLLVSLAAIKALFYELNSLPEQQCCICQMIGVGMSECEMAAQLEISLMTLRHRKLELLRKLKILLKEYY